MSTDLWTDDYIHIRHIYLYIQAEPLSQVHIESVMNGAKPHIYLYIQAERLSQVHIDCVMNGAKPRVLVRVGDDLYRRPKEGEEFGLEDTDPDSPYVRVVGYEEGTRQVDLLNRLLAIHFTP